MATIGNVCFLVDKNKNEVLLLRRNRNPMNGLWTGVGGKTEQFEDVHESCSREAFEETGFTVQNLKLKGVLKTILSGKDSSWLLFVYTSSDFYGEQKDCDEGELRWVKLEELENYELIGFIRRIIAYTLDDKSFFEGTILHNEHGHVLEEKITVSVV